MRKHGTNCDCGMCTVGKAIGMIKKSVDNNEHSHEYGHEHDYNKDHEHKE